MAMKLPQASLCRMEYVLKQKLLSLGNNFTIRDVEGRDAFQVKGKLLSIGDKLSLEDLAGNELIYIEQQFFNGHRRRLCVQPQAMGIDHDCSTLRREPHPAIAIFCSGWLLGGERERRYTVAAVEGLKHKADFLVADAG